jgi:hypothetical protein
MEVFTNSDKMILENWLVFHSFVSNSREAISYYVREGYPDQLEILDAPSQFAKNFDDFTTDIYYRDIESAKLIKDKSYAQLFAHYEVLSLKEKDLVKNYLVDFNEKQGRLDRQLFDKSYWQIVKHYSITDKIIGQPPFCSEELTCQICKAGDLKHHKIPASKWLEVRLKEIMGTSSWLDTYLAIINAARTKIRHASVHAAKMPTAKSPDHSKVDRVDYDLTKTIGSFEEDKHALKALDGMFESVVWHLLMDYLFGHKVFERPTGYSVQYLRISMPKDK